MSAPAKIREDGQILESVLIKGDLSKLTPDERHRYYAAVCDSVGLNPLTQPFAYITLNHKLVLYALRACTDQLRTLHKVSVVDLVETEREGVFVVTAKVANAEGRTDMAKGAVTISGLKGDALANALMRCETKAKRRATLSLCGLGFLDETEIETIPEAARNGAVSAPARNGRPRQTQEVISARKKMREDAHEGVIHDLADIQTEAQLDRWAAETLTPEFMGQLSLGHQATISERVEAKRLELAAAVEAAEPEEEPEPQAAPLAQRIPLPERAGILCGTGAFWVFLQECYPGWAKKAEGAAQPAAEALRAILGVKSRTELKPGTEAAADFQGLEREYRAWRQG